MATTFGLLHIHLAFCLLWPNLMGDNGGSRKGIELGTSTSDPTSPVCLVAV